MLTRYYNAHPQAEEAVKGQGFARAGIFRHAFRL
jgi:hypothetical protein